MRVYVAIASLFIVSGFASAEDAKTEFGPVVKNASLQDWHNTEQSYFHSRFTGHDYLIKVSLPSQYFQGNDRYPVFYVLDYDAFWDAAAHAVEGLNIGNHIEPCIVVGLPMKVGSLLEVARKRFYDFSPTRFEAADKEYSRLYQGTVTTGGASNFTRALKEELIPWIDKRYRTTNSRGIGGFSLSGLFAAWMLVSDPGYFQTYIIGSAPLQWDNNLILKREAEVYSSGKQISGRVLLGAGSLETGTIQIHKAFEDVLKSRHYPNLEVKTYHSEGDNHMSAAQHIFAKGMMELYPRYKVVRISGKLLDDYSGLYELEPGNNVRLDRVDQKLVLRIPEQEFEFYPYSDTEFFSPLAFQARFVRGVDGKVKEMVLRELVGDTVIKRVGN